MNINELKSLFGKNEFDSLLMDIYEDSSLIGYQNNRYIKALDKFESLSATLQKNDLIDRATHIENLELIKASGKIAEQAVARFATIAESEMGQIFDENGIDI